MLQKLIFIALAGGLGTLARYGLAGLAQRWAGSGFPWGTLSAQNPPEAPSDPDTSLTD